MGPGSLAGMTGQAKEALAWARVVVGYHKYLEMAAPLLAGKQTLTSGMTKEMDRAARAMDLAMEGNKVALVSSGDPGIYAMAAVVFELVRARGVELGRGAGRLDLAVIPGVPAVAACAALMGAPLSHDFACISLSDRLTPWELIAKRLDLAARGDFVIALYNPKSKGRDWQYGQALELIAKHRSLQTPVGVANRAGRQGEGVQLTTLGRASEAEVDMQTLVIVGNSMSFVEQGRMVTPRGYTEKYGA